MTTSFQINGFLRITKLPHRWAANATALFASAALFASLILMPTETVGEVITNHSYWYDTQGNLIDCHEGGILRVGDTFYWYGREYVGNTQGTYGAAGAQYRCGLRCYSSTDLVNWTYRGKVLSYPASGWLTNGTWHRPRVLHNAATSTYVLRFFMFPPGGTLPMTHVVATASTPTGPFTVITGPAYKVGGDLALLQDTDGQGYICSDDYYTRSSWVTRLTSNFQDTTTSTVNAIPSSSYGGHEGQSIIRYKGKIIVAGSGVVGLNPSETSYAVADAPLGPYTYKGNMSQQLTWSSQMGSFLYIAETDTLMALCDQWRRGPNGETVIAQQSCYLWLPVTFDPVTGVAQMQHVNQWDPFASGAIIDQTNAAFTFTPSSQTNWETYSDALDYGGSHRTAITSGTSVSISFTGKRAQVMGIKANNRGIVSVKLDGVAKPNIDFYSPTTLYKALVYDTGTLASGAHTIVLAYTGTKNAASSGYRFTVDALTVPTFIDQTNAAFTYTPSSQTNWETYSDALDYGGTHRTAITSGTSVSISFTGTRAQVLGLKANNRGIVSVKLDGVSKPNIDFYSPTTVYQWLAFDTGALTSGTHTIVIAYTGTKNAASSGYRFSMDALMVTP